MMYYKKIYLVLLILWPAFGYSQTTDSVANEVIVEQIAEASDELYDSVITPQPDTNAVQITPLSTEKIKSFRSNKDYDYLNDRAETKGILQRLREYLIRLLANLFSTPNSGEYASWMMYVLLAIILGIAIVKLAGIDVSFLFFRDKNKQVANLALFNEDIHEINFEQAIQDAINRSDFHRATQLLYLRMLKNLADNEQIKWKAGKTNHEYEHEITAKDIKEPFKQLTYLFEYICYGHFDVDRERFETVQAAFNRLQATAIHKKA